MIYQYDERGGIWTTLDAMNAAVGMAAEPDPEQTSVERVV